jgi:trimeric autotransporter adhesin
MKTRIPPVLITLALICFELSPTAKALLPPPSPDGGYPGGNTAEGINALHNVNTAMGINNTAVGLNALTNDTTGQYNVAVGSRALENNTTGDFNMAIGTEALRDNNANFNLAIGFRVGFMNTTGNHLTGVGAAALRNNTIGTFNTAIGADALRENTTGDYNTAVGAGALNINATGSFNTATGISALAFNRTGDANTAAGSSALLLNTTGEFNTAIGDQALYSNRSGNDNTAIGSSAMLLSGGSNNIALGSLAGSNLTSGDNNIDIGNSGAGAESDTIRIGDSALQNRTFVAGISGIPVTGTTVVVNGSGQLGVSPSSQRFKDKIRPMGRASEAILALKPVTFRYKKEIDSEGILQFGLVAEEVEKLNPDLVVRDKEGKPYTVRYDQVNAMLLNEFLKEHKKVEKLEATVVQQQENFQSKLAEQQKQIAALTAGLQKVSDQLVLSKPAPQVVKNNQ